MKIYINNPVKLFMIFTLTASFLFSQPLASQNIVVEPAANEILVLRLNEYAGSLQWQVSPDGEDWGDVPNGAADTLEVSSSNSLFYRGSVTVPGCPEYYTDPVQILAGLSSSITVDGELKVWHKLTLSFDGPVTSEQATPNPFRDYRMNVEFTKGTKTYRVPGYYAADGNAANSSAIAGSKWRVHFRPDEPGIWTYKVSFREGTDVAMKLDTDNSGSLPWLPLDGTTGEISVSASDKKGSDLRNPDLGRVVYDGTPYLKYSGSGRPYLKSGQGSPENFLAYYEFDQTKAIRSRGGIASNLLRYNVHETHYNALGGGPTWQAGKGKNIIGAVNYLASRGVNAMYFVSYNIGPSFEPARAHSNNDGRTIGDGGDVWPWTSESERYRFDVSKLEQWDIVFTHMNNKGIGLTFFLAECENEEAFDISGATSPLVAMGPERALYYREMVAHFGHHLNIMWVISEETGMHTFSPELITRNKERMKRVTLLDPYNYPVGLHNPGPSKAPYATDYGDSEYMTYYSAQTFQEDFSQTFDWILRHRNESETNAGNRWVVICDEPGKFDTGLVPDGNALDPNHNNARKNALWGTLMAGGSGVSWYHGYKYPHADLNCEDFTLREDMLRQTRNALDFFCQNGIPIHEMRNRQDLLADASGRRLLAKEGEVYVVQLLNGGSASLKMAGLPDTLSFSVHWYDPFAGGDFQTGTVDTIYGGADRSIGNPPNNATNDWLCLVTSGTLKKTGPFLEEDGLLIIEMESTDSPLGLWIEKTDVPGYTGTCHFEFTGNNPSSGPPNSPLSYTFKINMTGNYHLNLRARKRLEGQPADRCNDCYVKMEGDFTSGNPAYPTSTLTQNTKLYGGAANGWGWATNLDGNGAHNTDAAIYNLKAGETYTLTISGRSQRFNLDRIVLRHSSVSNEDARDPSRPESRRGSSPATPPPPVNHLILNAISFPVLLVDGFVPYYIDSELFTNYQIDRKVLRIIK